MDNAICIHAWAYVPDGTGTKGPHCDQEYTDGPIADGWCVYVRTDTGIDPSIGIPFDIGQESDWPDYLSAMGHAYRIQHYTNFPIVEY